MIDTASPAVEGRDGLERPTAGSRREERDVKVEITVKVVGDKFPFTTLAKRDMFIAGDYPAAVDVQGAVNGMILDVAMEARAKLEAVAQAEAQGSDGGEE